MAKTKISRREFIAAAGMGAAALTINCSAGALHAETMGPKNEYPVVVIGAGLGGLTCAAYFARHGIPVTVVEQHDVAGGYATAFERAAGKYRFEVSLHGTSINNNAPAQILDELGVLSQLELVRLPEILRIKTKSGDVVVPQGDPQSFIEQLSRRFPDESEGIAGFVNEMLAIHEETESYGRKSEALKRWTKIFFPLLYPKMWKVRSQNLEDMLNQHVQSEDARNLLSFLWGYYGLPPEQLSAFYYATATGGYLKNGSYYIKDRSQRLSDLLVDTIEAGGGRLLFGTAVERVRMTNGAVSGVALSDGRELPARAVVSNASAVSLVNQLMPPNSVPDNFIKKINSYRPSISSFIVWLGLNRPLRGNVPGFSTSISSGRSPTDAYQMARQGRIESIGYNVCVYDNLYDGYSSAGTSTLMLFALSGYEPWKAFEADYRAGRKRDYRLEKERWTETLIRRTQQDLIPNLTSMIEVQDAATPLTNWRYTGNTQGAIYGFEQSLENAYMNRVGNQTPVKGLYIAGAWGNPGGGYAGVLRSGKSTFYQVMQAWGAV